MTGHVSSLISSLFTFPVLRRRKASFLFLLQPHLCVPSLQQVVKLPCRVPPCLLRAGHPSSFEQQFLSGHSSSRIKSSVPSEAPRGTEAAFPAPALELESNPEADSLTADEQPCRAVFCAPCTRRGRDRDLPFRLTANSVGDRAVSNHSPSYLGRGKNAFYKTFIKNIPSAQGGRSGPFHIRDMDQRNGAPAVDPKS